MFYWLFLLCIGYSHYSTTALEAVVSMVVGAMTNQSPFETNNTPLKPIGATMEHNENLNENSKALVPLATSLNQSNPSSPRTSVVPLPIDNKPHNDGWSFFSFGNSTTGEVPPETVSNGLITTQLKAILKYRKIFGSDEAEIERKLATQEGIVEGIEKINEILIGLETIKSELGVSTDLKTRFVNLQAENKQLKESAQPIIDSLIDHKFLNDDRNKSYTPQQLQNAASALDSKIKELSQQIETAKKEKHRAIKGLQQTNQILKEENFLKQTRLDENTVTIHSSEEKIELLEKKSQSLHNHTIVQSDLLEQQKELIIQKDNTYNRLNSRLQQITKILELPEPESEDIVTTVQNLQTTKQSLEKEIDTLKIKDIQAKEKTVTLQATIETLNQEIKSFKNQIEQSRIQQKTIEEKDEIIKDQGLKIVELEEQLKQKNASQNTEKKMTDKQQSRTQKIPMMLSSFIAKIVSKPQITHLLTRIKQSKLYQFFFTVKQSAQ